MSGIEELFLPLLLPHSFLQTPFSVLSVILTYVVICSHEEIDVSHPDFFATAKLNGYVPPNKEVN